MAAPIKWGSEFRINTTTLNQQFDSSVTALNNGRFVVTWTDNSELGSDTSSDAVKAQIFNANGSKSGTEFQVNTAELGSQLWSTTTTLADGRFVVAWSDASQSDVDFTGEAIRAQIFNPDGTASGGEFVVNATTPSGQTQPAITALASGGFAVIFTDASLSPDDNSGAAIRGRVYDASGVPGAEFRVNTTTISHQNMPTVTGLTDGRFVVSWLCNSASGGDTSGNAIRAQMFNADGTKFGVEFLVNTTTLDTQEQPNLTALAGGGFVATWTDHSPPDGGLSVSDIKAQVYAANGVPSGGEISVNTTTATAQNQPVTKRAGRWPLYRDLDRFQRHRRRYLWHGDPCAGVQRHGIGLGCGVSGQYHRHRSVRQASRHGACRSPAADHLG